MPLLRQTRRRSMITRDAFGSLQSDIFMRGADSGIRDMEASRFQKDTERELDQLKAQQQLSQDPGIYNIPGVKGLWEGTGTVLGGVTDYLGRPAQAVSGAVLAVQEGRPFWEGVGEGLKDEKPDLNFATVFERAGMENELARNVLGFALDVALDPLNLLALGPVRSVAGKLIRGVSSPVAAIPLHGKTFGARTDALTLPVQRRLAKWFSPRIGAHEGGDTYWEVRRWARGNTEREAAVEKLIKHDRRLKNYRRNRDKLAQSEFYENLHEHRKQWALRDRGSLGPEALTDDQATRIADEFLDEIQTNDELARAIGRYMHHLRDDLDEVAGLKKSEPLTDAIRNDEVAFAAWRQRAAGRESMRYDIAAERLEQAGITGEIFKYADEVDRAQGQFSMHGLGSLSRMVQANWGRRIAGKGDEIVEGELRALTEKYLNPFGIGEFGTESFYIPKFFPSSHGVNQAVRKAKNSGLHEQVSDRAKESITTAEQMALFEPDFRVVFAHDIGARRMGIEASKIINDDVLKTMSAHGGSTPIGADEIAGRIQDLTARSKDTALFQHGDIGIRALYDQWRSSVPTPLIHAADEVDAFLHRNGVMSEAPVYTADERAILSQADEILRQVDDIERYAALTHRPYVRGEPGDLFIRTSSSQDKAILLRAAELRKARTVRDKAYGEMRNILLSTPRQGEDIYIRGKGNSLLLSGEEAEELSRAAGRAMPTAVSKEETWILPKPIAQSLNKFNDPLEMTGFLKAVDSFNAIWKPTVTVFPLFVSFFTRNAIGLVHNLMLSGMGPRAIYGNGLRAGQLMKGGTFNKHGRITIDLSDEGHRRVVARANNVEPDMVTEEMLRTSGSRRDFSLQEALREMYLNGGLNVGSRGIQPLELGAAGRTGGFAEAAASLRGEAAFGSMGPTPGPEAGVEAFRGARGGVGTTLRKAYSAIRGEEAARLTSMERTKAAIANYGRSMTEQHGWNPFGYGTTANQAMDNHARLTHILWRLKQGDEIPEASRSAAKYVGDYTELGAATTQLASVIPFFRWTRFNVPLQVEGLLTRPYIGSKLAAVTGDEAMQEQLATEGATLPDWVLDRHHIVMGKTKEGRLQIIRGLGLPIEDLNKLFSRTGSETFKNILSEATPILRVPFEGLALNYSFFTGEPIDDDSDLYGFYRRGYAWATAPVVSQSLNRFLQVKREVNPDTGRVSYRSDNPMGMYVWASFFGRFSQTFSKVIEGVESREEVGFGTAVSLLTGVKNSEVFPDRPPTTSLDEALTASPYLQNLHREYQQISIYPQFNNAEKSRQASRGIASINQFRRVRELAVGRKVRWAEAARLYGAMSESHREEELAARMVKSRGRKRAGLKQRAAFRKRHPAYDLALAQNLTDHEKSIALDSDVSPS